MSRCGGVASCRYRIPFRCLDPRAPGARRSPRRRLETPPQRSGAASTVRYAPAILILVVSTGLGVTLALTASRPTPESEVVDRPVQVTGDGYVSSDTCRACHPSEYESWHGSYHRTMDPGCHPRHRQRRLRRRAGRGGARQPDAARAPGRRAVGAVRRPGLGGAGPRAPPHPAARGHDDGVAPPERLLVRHRARPRAEHPARGPTCSPRTSGCRAAPSCCTRPGSRWRCSTATGTRCASCATRTQGRTAFDTPYRSAPFAEQAIDTTVAEFGIACESCHGPAQAHLAANRNPLRRYASHLAGDGDPTIVQPRHPRSGAVVAGLRAVPQRVGVLRPRRTSGGRAARGCPTAPATSCGDTRFIVQPAADRTSAEIRSLVAADPEFVPRVVLARRHHPGLGPRVQRAARLPPASATRSRRNAR